MCKARPNLFKGKPEIFLPLWSPGCPLLQPLHGADLSQPRLHCRIVFSLWVGISSFVLGSVGETLAQRSI